MVLAYLLIFLPAFALSSKDSVAIVPAEDLKVCEYFDARIIRLGEIINEELRPDVDVHSDLYITLEESKLCDTVGYVAIPECVAKKEGDECVARKTSEMIRKSLRAAMKAEKIKAVPSGEKFFATCKHIGYKNVLKTFKSARSLMSAECGLPGLGGGRSRRSLDLLPALLLGGSYDPSSIWFQYFLCKDIDLYCYFFTQGWTQGQYGQYYLYDNLLDDTTGLFAGSTDSNLATIALLGGLGGGIGQPSGYYPSYGAHVAAPAPAPGRKRRESDDGDDVDGESGERKRRAVDCEDLTNHQECMRKRRAVDCEDRTNINHPECKRKRRAVDCEDPTYTNHPECKRKRRAVDCEDRTNSNHPECKRKRRAVPDCEDPANINHQQCMRKRREVPDCEDPANINHSACMRKRRAAAPDCEDHTNFNHPKCKRKRRTTALDCEEGDDASCRRRRQAACEACESNPDSTECTECTGL